MVYYVIAIVLVAFVFDFINGFHDSANSIATIVGTRVLSPLAAVFWAAPRPRHASPSRRSSSRSSILREPL